MPCFELYAEADKPEVFEIFASNSPQFLIPETILDLDRDMDNPDLLFWTMRLRGEVVGFGGVEIGHTYNVTCLRNLHVGQCQTRVQLIHGMVRRDLHGRGLGRALVRHRIAEAARLFGGGESWVMAEAPRALGGFYERCGFSTVETWAERNLTGARHVVLRMKLAPPVAANAAPELGAPPAPSGALHAA